MDSVKKKQNRGLLFGGYAYGGAYAGFGSATANNAPSYTTANFGSRLCLKSDELATYCGRQFIELWFDYRYPDLEITSKDWAE